MVDKVIIIFFIHISQMFNLMLLTKNITFKLLKYKHYFTVKPVLLDITLP